MGIRNLRLLPATKMADFEDPVTPPQLQPCSICSRTFLPESLGKHYKTCEKNASKKRKIFDSTKQRVQGTDLAAFLPVILKTKKVEKEKTPTRKEGLSKWKEQHLEFVRAIRAARGVNDGEQEASMGAITRPSNHEQCPTCERNFGPKAYDRHIEWCREKHARLPSKSNASTEAVMAKERLEARTKYRAPPLNKSRREMTREKYSSSRSGAGDSKRAAAEKMSPVNHTQSQASPHLSSPKETSSAPNFQRTPHRSSYRQRSASPVKRPTPPVVSNIASDRREATNNQLRPRGVSPQKVRRDVRESPQKATKKVQDSPAQKQGRNPNNREPAAETRNRQRETTVQPPPPKKNDSVRNRKTREAIDPILANGDEDRGSVTEVEETSCNSIYNSQQQVLTSIPVVKTRLTKERSIKPGFTPSKVTYDNSIYKQDIGEKSPLLYRTKYRRTSGELKSLSSRKPTVTVAVRQSNREVLPVSCVNISEGNFEINTRPFNEKLRGGRKVRATNIEWETNLSSKDHTPRPTSEANAREVNSVVSLVEVEAQTDSTQYTKQTDNVCFAGMKERNEGQSYSDCYNSCNGNQVVQPAYLGLSDESVIGVNVKLPNSSGAHQPLSNRKLGGLYSVDTNMGQTSSSCADGPGVIDINVDHNNDLHLSENVDDESLYSAGSNEIYTGTDVGHTYSDRVGGCCPVDIKMNKTNSSRGYSGDAQMENIYSDHLDSHNEEISMGRTYSICSDRPTCNGNVAVTYSGETVTETINMSRTYTVTKSTVSEQRRGTGKTGKSCNDQSELSLADLNANSEQCGLERNHNTAKQSTLLLNLSCKSVSDVDFTSPLSFRSSNMTSTPIRSADSCDFQHNVSMCGDVKNNEFSTVVDQSKLKNYNCESVSKTSKSTRNTQSHRSKSSREDATKYTITNGSMTAADIDTKHVVTREDITSHCLAVSDVDVKTDKKVRAHAVPRKFCADNFERRRGSYSCDSKERIFSPDNLKLKQLHGSAYTLSLRSDDLELNLDQLSNIGSVGDVQEGESVRQYPEEDQEVWELSCNNSYIESEQDCLSNGSKDMACESVSIFNDDCADAHVDECTNDSLRSFLSVCESYYKPQELCKGAEPLASDLTTLQMSTSDDSQNDVSPRAKEQLYQPVLRYWGSDFRLSFEENKSFALSKLKWSEPSGEHNVKIKNRNIKYRKLCSGFERNNALSIADETTEQVAENLEEPLVTEWSNEDLAVTSKHFNFDNINGDNTGEATHDTKKQNDIVEQISGLQQELSHVQQDLLNSDLKLGDSLLAKRKILEPVRLMKNAKVVQEQVETFKVDTVGSENLIQLHSQSYLCNEQGVQIKESTTLPFVSNQAKNLSKKHMKSSCNRDEPVMHLPLIQLKETSLSARTVDTKLNISQPQGAETSFWVDQAVAIKCKEKDAKNESKLNYPNVSKSKEAESNFWIKQAGIIKLNDSNANCDDLKAKQHKKSKPKESENNFWAKQAEVIKLNELTSNSVNSKLKHPMKTKPQELETNFWAEQAEIVRPKFSDQNSRENNVKLKHSIQSKQARSKESEPSFWAEQAELIKMNEMLIENDDFKNERSESNNCEEQIQAAQIPNSERRRIQNAEEYQNYRTTGTKSQSRIPVSHRQQESIPIASHLHSSNMRPTSQSLVSQSGSFHNNHHSTAAATRQMLFAADDESEEEERGVVVKRGGRGVRRTYRPEEGEELSSPENNTTANNNRRMGNRNTDSAYSSLNRKSPLLSIRTILNHSDLVDSANMTANMTAERMQLSSSGSEPELPQMSSLKISHDVRSPMGTEVSTPTPTNQLGSQQQEHSAQKMSKFCHECGYKFPLQMAKFCCECGVRRLVV